MSFWKCLMSRQLDRIELAIHHLKEIAMATQQTQADVAQGIRDAKVQLDKIAVESAASLQKIADLEAAIAAGGPVSQEVQDALADLKTSIQRVDDLVPDTPPPPPAP